jgi:hypothetical protein
MLPRNSPAKGQLELCLFSASDMVSNSGPGSDLLVIKEWTIPSAAVKVACNDLLKKIRAATQHDQMNSGLDIDSELEI